MKYFLDTEFIEQPNTIQLISIGIYCENGEKFYAISNEYNEELANDWVKENVIAKLEPEMPRISNTLIKWRVLEFIKRCQKDKSPIEFYGYYSDYDWVVFCWIFGKMIELPDGFPMYCRDLKQMMDERGLGNEWKNANCPEPEGEHNALIDAEWNYKLYNQNLTKSTT